jgi:hypothetical protein
VEGVPEARDSNIKLEVRIHCKHELITIRPLDQQLYRSECLPTSGIDGQVVDRWIGRNNRCLHGSKRRHEIVSFALVHWEYRRAAKRALDAFLYPYRCLAAKLESVFLGFPTDMTP